MMLAGDASPRTAPCFRHETRPGTLMIHPWVMAARVV